MHAAVDLLLRCQSPKGYWKDFDTLAGASDEWVSSYIAFALAQYGSDKSLKAAGNGLRWLLKSPFYRKGWGYHRKVPIDADSTAWVIRLAQLLKRDKHWKIRRAKNNLTRFIHPEGGLKTYHNDYRIRWFTRLHKNISFKGWCSPHVCVTANACNIRDMDRRADLIYYLIEKQSREGFWESYWWESHAFATSLIMDSKVLQESAAGELAIQWGTKEAKQRLNLADNSNPFDTALLLNIVLDGSQTEQRTVEKLISMLRETQLGSGGWKGTAALRIPPPGVTNPNSYKRWIKGGKGGGSIIYDQNGLFTNATILSALIKAKQFLNYD